MNKSRKIALACIVGLIGVSHATGMGETKVPVLFSGGDDTEPRDRGRPVVLISAALGVKTEVFRDAFSGVKPAKDGKPSKQEAQRNKEVLMKALKPHGVSPELLDEVSNYYRYRPGKGSLWKATGAKAYA